MGNPKVTVAVWENILGQGENMLREVGTSETNPHVSQSDRTL